MSFSELVRQFVEYYRPQKQENDVDWALARVVAKVNVDPNRARAEATELRAADPTRFSEAALRLLQTSGDAAIPALRPLLTLDIFMRGLFNPSAFSRLDAVRLVRELRRFDSRLDVHLVTAFIEDHRQDPSPPDAASVQRVLELVGEVTDNAGRVQHLLSSLQKVEHAWVRSKIVAILASRAGASRRNEELLRDPDPRIRANVIQGIWKTPDSPEKRQLFVKALDDGHQRVVGNALVGLARMRDPSALRGIYDLSRHSSPEFRATAAWAMGEICCASFRPVLVELMQDDNPRVRQNALRALSRLRRKEEAEAATPAPQPTPSFLPPPSPPARRTARSRSGPGRPCPR
ncbi:MAG: HEAT repeat domain-containing protein [Bryobacteraceae bacterium]|nr:HEAT repeat domain-containing protein [Bryobacteraceae bacterium]